MSKHQLAGGFSFALSVCWILFQPSWAEAVLATSAHANVDRLGKPEVIIPISIPLGTGGIQPKISLRYSGEYSDARTLEAPSVLPAVSNYFAGIGWSLDGLSSITRCPKTVAADQVAAGVQLGLSDKFCLNGQPLVIQGNPQSYYGMDGVEYRTEAESFVRVVSWGSDTGGPAWFRAWTKTGEIIEFGNSPDSKFRSESLTGETPPPHEWAVNKLSDRFGSYYAVSYAVGPGSGAPLPARIDYTGNANAGVVPFSSIRFVYEARPDATTSLIGRNAVRHQDRLVKIQSFVDEALVHEKRITYQVGSTSGRSRIESVSECATDSNCLAPIQFTYGIDGGGITTSGIDSVQTGNLVPASTTIAGLHYGDFNGDGRQDVLVVDAANAARVCYGPNLTSCSGSWGISGVSLTVLDYDGDGLSDLAMQRSNGQIALCKGPQVAVCTNAPNAYYNPANYQIGAGDVHGNGRDYLIFWPRTSQAYARICDPAAMLAGTTTCSFRSNYPRGDFKILRGDFNSDGKSDFLLLHGSGYFRCDDVANPATNGCGEMAVSYIRDSNKILVGDFNGDKRDDVAVVWSGGVLFCTGRKLSQWDECTQIPSSVGSWTEGDALAADFNGDGVQDLLLVANNQTRFCSGPGITQDFNCTVVRETGVAGELRIAADYDGNATSDLITSGGRFLKLSRGAEAVPDLLVGMTNSAFNTVASFEHAPLTDASVYIKGYGADYPLQETQKPAYVVSVMGVPNGVGGTNLIDYSYTAGRTSVDGRGFSGYATVTATDIASGQTTTSSWLQMYPFTGTVESVVRSVPGQPQSKFVRTSGYVTTFENRQFPATLSDVELTQGMDGIWKSQKTVYEYDQYGNVLCATSFDDETTAIYKSMLCNTYSNDTAGWLFGRLVTQSNTFKNASGAVLTQSHSYESLPGTLLIKKHTRDPNNAPLRLVTEYGRDIFGNLISATVSGEGLESRTATSTFDARGRFEITRTNALGHVTTQAFDGRFGKIIMSTDPNGVQTEWGYDVFGRLAFERGVGGVEVAYQYEICCSNYALNPNLAYRAKRSVTGLAHPTFTYFDVLDRPVLVTIRNFSNTGWIDYGNTWFDAAGRVSRRYLPYDQEATNPPFSSWTYDVLGRVTTQADANGATTSFSYAQAGGNVTTTQTNALSQTSTQVRNVRGHLTKATDSTGRQVTYIYDGLGNITSTNNGGVTLPAEFNHWGWNTKRTEPNLTTWELTYDALGQLRSQKDLKNQTTTFDYDKLGRQVARTEPSLNASWTWDTAWKGLGMIAASVAGQVTKTYTYDSWGRRAGQTLVSGSESFGSFVSYDELNRVSTVTYPTGYAVRNVYNSTGYMSEVRQATSNALHWKAAVVTPVGVMDEDFGNGTGISRVFDPSSRRVTQIGVVRDSDAALLLNYVYGYDALGNLTSRSESTQGLGESFSYDIANRLTSVASSTATRTLTYGGNGNITSKSDVGTYVYPSYGRVDAVTIAGGVSYTYDANGNALTAGPMSLTWTSFNMLSQATNGANSYSWTYDANRRRVSHSAPGYSTSYVNAFDLLLYEKQTSSTGISEHRHYVYANGKVVAVHKQQSIGTSSTQYLYRDYLGSNALVLDSGGAELERLSYDSHGKRRFHNGADSEDIVGTSTARGYTGHEHIDGLKLIHMNGRVYDAKLGRFLSPDPAKVDLTNPQSFNRYTYVNNNPMRFVDPSGFYMVDEYEDGGGGFSFWPEGDFGEGDDEGDGGGGSGSSGTGDGGSGNNGSDNSGNPVVVPPDNQIIVTAQAPPPTSNQILVTAPRITVPITSMPNIVVIAQGPGGPGGNSLGPTNTSPTTRQCVGLARVIAGNPATIGLQGGFPRTNVRPGSAAIAPEQWGGNSPALRRGIPYIRGRGVGGNLVFDGVTDTIGHRPWPPGAGFPPAAANFSDVRAWLMHRNPGHVLIEVVSDPSGRRVPDGGQTTLVFEVPVGQPCPANTTPSGP